MFPKRPRLKTFDYLGRHRYFLTFCTVDRHEAFLTDEAVSIVRSEILKASGQSEFVIPAYVFMPDHIHLLVRGCSDASDLRRFASLAKQRSGFEYSRVRNRHLWQTSYYDHVLRPEESTISVVYYILQNPVRAGLVNKWRDYPFFGSETMTLSEIETALKDAGTASWDV